MVPRAEQETGSIKDFFEHLRMVHFSLGGLVAVTLAIIAVLISSGSRDSHETKRQIREISNTVDKCDPNFLRRVDEIEVKRASLRKTPLPSKTIDWADDVSGY